MENTTAPSMTNGEYIKSLISLETLLYKKFREAQDMKNLKISEMMNRGEIRCANCKTKIRQIKNNFFDKNMCDTCMKCSDLERENRQDIYKNVDGKWKRVKYRNNGWWFNKH